MAKGAKTGGGSRKGVPNKAASCAREAIARFVDDNAGRMQGWLDEIADDVKLGPQVAFKCVQEILEYHVPKLARTELTGANGGPLVVVQSTKEDEKL